MRRLTATSAIAAVTILISIAVEFGPDSLDAPMRAGFIPARLSGVPTDYAAVPVWLTPLTSAVLHANVVHLISNLMILVFTGRACEVAFGGRRLVMLYLAGAYAAAIAQWLVDPGSVIPMIGASGAASAVFGAYSALYGQVRAMPIGRLSAWTVNAIWLGVAWAAVNILADYALRHSGIMIAAAAHVGGFLAGLILARPLLRAYRRRRQAIDRG